MRTRNPLSTISYNSDQFISVHLDDLVRRGDLQYWAFVNHKAEDQEKRDHKHVFVLPNGLVDTNNLSPMFDELAADGQINTCKLWLPSKWGDWYLYALHDPGYLACKYDNDRPKKYRYWDKDIIVSDPDIKQALMERINYTELMSPSFKLVREHASAGIPIKKFLELFPIKKSDLRYIKEIYDLYFEGKDET